MLRHLHHSRRLKALYKAKRHANVKDLTSDADKSLGFNAVALAS